MKMNSYLKLDQLCFSDFSVYSINVNLEKKDIVINLEGATLIEKNGIKELGKGYLQIKSFDKIEAKLFNKDDKILGHACIEQIMELKEINDHIVDNNSLTFYGFINDGSWLECKIAGGRIELNFNDRV